MSYFPSVDVVVYIQCMEPPLYIYPSERERSILIASEFVYIQFVNIYIHTYIRTYIYMGMDLSLSDLL